MSLRLLAAALAAAALVGASGCSGVDGDASQDSSGTSSQTQSGGGASSAPEEDKEVYRPETPELDPELGVITDLADLYQTNSDLVGYLRIDGTSLDTPIVQGEDNSYYLDHTFEKEYNAYGVPFLDFRAVVEKDMQSDNLTIYGHAGKDGSLFGAVKEYSDIEYYKEHPYLTFDTVYGKAEYKVVGAFLARVYTDASKQPNEEEFNYHMFVDAEGNGALFDDYMEKVYERSYWTNPDVDVSYGDKLVTLSTCDSEIHEFGAPTEYRRVLVARRIRQGEVLEVDVSKAEENTDMIMPKAWQDKYGKENPYK